MALKSIAERNAARAATGVDPGIGEGGNEICDKCGWWCKRVGRFSNNECDPKRGQAAEALSKQLSDSPSTKMGWGFGQLVFEPVAGDEDLHVRFDVNHNGTFDLEDVWLLGRVKADAAADLVRVIAAWRKRWT